VRNSILTINKRSQKAIPRVGLFLGAVIILSLVLSVLVAPAAKAVSYSSEEIAFAQLINNYRVSKGLQPLLVSDRLSEAGDRHSSDMGKYRFFDHYTTGGSDWFAIGSSPWDRMAVSGYSYNTSKGENIAAGYATAAAVFTGWKNSAGHNANMLSANFKVLGISLVTVSGSLYATYWTTDFGGYVDPGAHSIGGSTTTTAAPTTTTARPTTTTVRPTTTTTRSTTTTTRPPTTTTVRQTTTTIGPTTTTTARPTTTTTARPRPRRSFSDVSVTTPYYDQIMLLSDREIISGYVDGSFKPAAVVSRQQFAKMIVKTMGYQVSPLTPSGFLDVQPQPDPNDPLYPGCYIAVCSAEGIVKGKYPGYFAPYDEVTRAQLITMVARAADLPASPGMTPPFGDFSADHYVWAARAWSAGLLTGWNGMGSSFDFWAPATRAEVCLILANLLQR